MHRVAVVQSNYIPWKGYFDIIHAVDLFIFLDDVQYTVADWRNRNRVKTAQGPCWLTVPVARPHGRPICEVAFADDRWRLHHWETLRHCYGRAPYYQYYRPALEKIYREMSWEGLSHFNQYTIRFIAEELLGITCRFADSREFHVGGQKGDRLMAMLAEAGATRYLSGPAATCYLDREHFREAGVEIEYMDYSGYPEYPQFHPPFIHQVTVLDLLFHTGPKAPQYIWGWRDR